MDVETIAVNVSVGVLTGVITGITAGYFGLRSALTQFRTQRAFDRRLEWHERTNRAIDDFRRIHERIVLGFGHNRFDVVQEAVTAFDIPMREFTRSIGEGLLYADRATYLELKKMHAKIIDVTNDTHCLCEMQDIPGVRQMFSSLVKVLDETAFVLAKPVRKHLSLDKIKLADFEKGRASNHQQSPA